MGFPRKLKQMALFVDGRWVDEAAAVTLPKLNRKLEEYRGGGMNRPVKTDMGGEALEAEFTCAGIVRDILRGYGASIAGVALRFGGSYENDDTGEITSVEVVLRGRYEEIDMGEAKPGEDTELKAKMAVAYYKLIWDGRTEIEIDPINMIEIVDGFDLMAPHRAAIGLA